MKCGISMKCGLCLKIWNRSFVCVIQLLNTEYCDLVLKPILEISNMLVFKYCKINQSTKQYKSTKVQNMTVMKHLPAWRVFWPRQQREVSQPPLALCHYVTMSLCSLGRYHCHCVTHPPTKHSAKSENIRS